LAGETQLCWTTQSCCRRNHRSLYLPWAIESNARPTGPDERLFGANRPVDTFDQQQVTELTKQAADTHELAEAAKRTFAANRPTVIINSVSVTMFPDLKGFRYELTMVNDGMARDQSRRVVVANPL
jgi:hypothetical protein